MLNFDVTTQFNSIEELFCKKFESLKKHPMEQDVAKIMIQLLFSKKLPPIPNEDKPFLFQLIEKRIDVMYSYTLEEKIILFLTFLTETPGIAVMYLTYLQYWAKKNEMKHITFDAFCQLIFPMGFPSNDDLHTLWNEQKVNTKNTDLKRSSDNLLDYPIALTSIQFSSYSDDYLKMINHIFNSFISAKELKFDQNTTSEQFHEDNKEFIMEVFNSTLKDQNYELSHNQIMNGINHFLNYQIQLHK